MPSFTGAGGRSTWLFSQPARAPKAPRTDTQRARSSMCRGYPGCDAGVENVRRMGLEKAASHQGKLTHQEEERIGRSRSVCIGISIGEGATLPKPKGEPETSRSTFICHLVQIATSARSASAPRGEPKPSNRGENVSRSSRTFSVGMRSGLAGNRKVWFRVRKPHAVTRRFGLALGRRWRESEVWIQVTSTAPTLSKQAIARAAFKPD